MKPRNAPAEPATTDEDDRRSEELVREANRIFQRRGWPCRALDEPEALAMFEAWASSTDPAHHHFSTLFDALDVWLESRYAEDGEMHCVLLLFLTHRFQLMARQRGLRYRCALN